MELRDSFRIGSAWAMGAFLLAATFLSPGRALGEGMEIKGWGVRVGISSDPDQIVLGMHVNLTDLAQNLRLVPNADIGFGDDMTVFTLNPDLVYSVPLEDAGSLYFGGTVGLVYWRLDEKLGVKGVDDSDVGIAGVIGYELPSGGNPIFVDLKIGITDEYPDLKLLVGYSFLR